MCTCVCACVRACVHARTCFMNSTPTEKGQDFINIWLLSTYVGGPGAQLIRGHMSMGGPQGPGPGQMMGQGPPASNTMMTSGSSMSGGGGMSSGGHGGGSGSGQPTATAVATYRYVTVVSKGPGQSSAQTPCKKCGVQPANPGHAWCQSCFQQQSWM